MGVQARTGTSGSLVKRSLQLGAAILLICAAITIWRIRIANNERATHRALAAVAAAGGSVRYDHRGGAVGINFGATPGTKPDDGTLEQIGHIGSLEEISFGGWDSTMHDTPAHRLVTDAGLRYLRNLPRLRTLNLAGTGVRGPGLAQLWGMHQLASLDLAFIQMTDDDLAYLKGFSDLEDLTIDSDAITDAGLIHLEGLTKLQSLGLASPLITTSGLLHLRSLTRLTSIGLECPQMKSLHPLEHLTELVSLHLYRTGIGDDDLSVISGFKELTMLDLSYCDITDEGMSYLIGLPELRWLSLDHTNVTDSAVISLSRLKKCRYLSVLGTRLTPRGVASLSEKCPSMRIIH